MSQLSPQKLIVLRRVVWGLTVVVLLLVGMMRRPEFKISLPDGISLAFLPAVHAVLNTFVAVCLILGLVAIKRGAIHAHKRWITAAMCLSIVFLLCYVSYHFTNEATRYGGVGFNRAVYFFLLISHISFAAISFPFILFTYLEGWANRREAHKKLAKLTFPMWLYVAVTGPICYMMLRPYY
jgi:putative membrane protein